MKFCSFCRKKLCSNYTAFTGTMQARPFATSYVNASKDQKPPKVVTNQINEKMKGEQSSFIYSERKTVTLENIFSDENRKQVQERMRTVKFVPRPGIVDDKARRAAVLVPLCYVKGEPSILFMVRSIYLKNHRGEISFPGGMEDPGDTDLTHTALRETFEEIGLPMDQVEVWGQMQPSFSGITGRWVTPVVGMCGEIDLDKLCLNSSEVEDVFTRTLASICDPANQRQTQFRFPGTKGYTIPVYLGGQYRIWGLSAVILHQFMTVLAPGLYNFKVRHRT